ncbi:septal ring lytic transglycosylase RlpA family protein [Prosthecobacter vanneervenii]|uniref:Rare lipoprotein A n=1 Tax=Prosthecobacter vanneervenii TaxID=48466 RepID=A0A7W8DLI3_9BACT|nr:septal ring lytic transglycosylase RlpA family protein [Prosthecobacter vanneervenii]MBB5034429.1 rare lipoprotein A [Prosthecobacter vanneervenii]
MTPSAFLRFLAITLPALAVSCAKPAYQMRGYASYIADQYAGHYTTSGAIYQPQGWTAAHNTLPFGTVVKVKNNQNGRTVNVTVNDRFPYYPNRVINLSRAAAEYIQLPYRQLGDVTVTAKTIPNAPAQTPSTYTAPPPAGYGSAPATAYKQPAASYRSPPPVRPTYPNSQPKTVKPYYNPSSVPPAGYGTTAPPAGLPPPPPGYR